MITEDLDTFSLMMFRLQLRVLALFHAPLLGAALRLTANKLMRLNIFLATDWEQKILQVIFIKCLSGISDKDIPNCECSFMILNKNGTQIN